MKKHFALFLMALGLCGVLSVCSAVPAQAASYPDIEGHWAKPAIERWSESGILKGYSDGRFAPDDSISRAQLSEILYRVWGCKPNSVRTFTDVPADAWYHDGLTTMAAYGVTITDGDMAHPDDPLTREEAFYMVARAFDIGADDDGEIISTKVSDGADISVGYRDRLRAMFSSKYLKGGSDGAFHPKRAVTRAEVIQVMDNLFDLYIDKPGVYTLGADKKALITSPGVTLTASEGKQSASAHIYVMNKALVAGDLTLDLDKKNGAIRLHGVCDGKPQWINAGDGLLVDPAGVIDLSDPKRMPHGEFARGTGTLADPYHIATGEQFRKAMELPPYHPSTQKHMVYYFELDNDIDLGLITESLRDPSYFSLDGNGHTVTYQMQGSFQDDFFDSYGLFQILTSDGYVRNLTVAGDVDLTLLDPGNVHRTMINFGALAGTLEMDLDNCHSKVNMTLRYPEGKMAYLNVGGLVGRANESILTNCTSQATIRVVAQQRDTLSCHVGGLAGVMTQATYISNSSGVSGAPSDSSQRQTILRQCGSSAQISVTGGYHAAAGGLVGMLTRLVNDPELTFEGYGTVEQCWSTADVTVADPMFQGDCGGIVGHFPAGTVRQCWAAPTLRITSSGQYFLENLGGIAGSIKEDDEAHLTDCWVNASKMTLPKGEGHYGGIVGRLLGDVTRCFVVGSEKFAPENAISYASWTETPPTQCFAAAGKSADDLTAFYETCQWDFETVWDNTGIYPILRGCGSDAQRAAQMTTGEKILL